MAKKDKKTDTKKVDPKEETAELPAVEIVEPVDTPDKPDIAKLAKAYKDAKVSGDRKALKESKAALNQARLSYPEEVDAERRALYGEIKKAKVEGNTKKLSEAKAKLAAKKDKKSK